MNVRTKKYKLEKGTYIKFGLKNVLRDQWWVALIVVAICGGYLIIPSYWWFIGAGIGVVLYLLFWIIQFTGVSQMDQSKILFERLGYEINSQQILIKISSKQGMPVKWDNIKRGEVGKDYMLLVINKVQLIHWPFRIFNTENERKFVETILKRKGITK